MLNRVPPPLPHLKEVKPGDTDNAVQDLRDDMNSLEGGMSWMGTSPKMPFRFMQSSLSPSKQSLTPQH